MRSKARIWRVEESLLVLGQTRNEIRIFKLKSLNALAIVFIIVFSGAVNAECQMPLGTVQTAPVTRSDLSYAMIVDDASVAEHRAHVRIALDDIEAFSLILTMHAYHGRYSIPILNFTASTEMGEVLASREYYKDKDRYWFINTRGSRDAIIDYDVIFGTIRGNYDQHLGYLGQDFGISMAEWVFLIPCDLSPSSIKVDFRLPAGWKAYTPWKRNGDEFYPQSLEYLATSTFALGNFDAYSRNIGRTNVTVAVYSAWSASAQVKLVETAFRIFDYQTALFGRSVGEQYLGVFSPVADDGKMIWGGEYSQSQGLSVQSPPDQSYHFIAAVQQFCHQIFHRWNGWEPYGMKMSSDDEQWFSEGTTVYYESKTLIDLGIMKEYSTLRNVYSEYLTAYFNTSMDMPVAMAGKYHRPEQETPAEFIMYGKSALTCLLLDINILKATNGERDLSLLLRKMYELYGDRKGSYSNAEVLRQLTKLADYDFADFFKRYVYGMERLPLNRYFTRTSLAKINEVWKIGDDLDLCATLTDFDNRPIAGETVTFYMNSTPIAISTTDNQGVARANYVMNDTGKLEIAVTYLGDKDYTRLPSSDSFGIAVRQVYSSVSLNLPSKASLGQLVVIAAIVKDEVGRPIDKANVDFFVLTEGEWRRIGSARTDVEGVARIPVLFNATGAFDVKVSYAGDWKYSESVAKRTLAVTTATIKALPDQMFLFASLVAVAIVIALAGLLKVSRQKLRSFI